MSSVWGATTHEPASLVLSNTDAVLAAVSYADVFDRAIPIATLHHHVVGRPLNMLETALAIDDLVQRGQLVRTDDVVHLPSRHDLAERHDERAERAKALWPAAVRWAQRIAALPLVRMVAVTGGLAAGSLAATDAIEFFIVARPRRLWTTHAFIQRIIEDGAQAGVKLTLGHLCTTTNVAVEHHSLHIANELANMTVVVGPPIAQNVRRSNDWVRAYLPGAADATDASHSVDFRPPRQRGSLEWMLLTPPARALEHRHRRHFRPEAPAVADDDATWWSATCQAGTIVRNAGAIEAAWRERMSAAKQPTR